MRAIDRRLNKLRRTIESTPAKRHLLEEAYDWLTFFGELPEEPGDEQLACEVVIRAMRGGSEYPTTDEEVEDIRRGVSVIDRTRKALDSAPPSVRALLFEEALFSDPRLRNLARAQISVEVAYGGDVESHSFGARHGLPMYGSVAMHIAGYPRRLVVPPYEEQGKRLLVRLDDVRGRIPHEDPRWHEAQAEAAVRLLQTGELPKDATHLDTLLVNVELDLLQLHKQGKDVSVAMGLFDRVAQERDEEKRLQALNQIRAMAAEGRFRGSGGWASVVPAT